MIVIFCANTVTDCYRNAKEEGTFLEEHQSFTFFFLQFSGESSPDCILKMTNGAYLG